MTPRRILFWIHLIAGCVAGLVILLMSVTGVLLAYRRQVIGWADRNFLSHPVQDGRGLPLRLPLEELLAGLQQTQGRTPSGITARPGSAAPVAFDFGRERTVFVDPYSGKILGEGSRRLRVFFSIAEDLHRFLGAGAERRSSGRAVTGACNLGFLILVTTGPFLWWPKEWNWKNLKKVALFRGGPWVRARDWNWHNVLGIWCAVPLFLIVITGVIMSYGWANNLLYRITGNAPPPQGPSAAQNLAERTAGAARRKGPEPAGHFDGLENLLARAEQQVPDWTAISLRLPNAPSSPVTFSIDRGNGGRPDLRSQLTLDRATGNVVRWEPFSSYNRGRQLRAWARFTHTGEAGGLLGQSLAALVSAGASFLVLTGLSLAVRRFVAWKLRRA